MCGRTGHPVATTPGPYRAEHLAYLVELADTGHYQTVTQTTVDLDDIAPAATTRGRLGRGADVFIEVLSSQADLRRFAGRVPTPAAARARQHCRWLLRGTPDR